MLLVYAVAAEFCSNCTPSISNHSPAALIPLIITSQVAAFAGAVAVTLSLVISVAFATVKTNETLSSIKVFAASYHLISKYSLLATLLFTYADSV